MWFACIVAKPATPGREGFPAARVPREIVRLDRTDGDDAVCPEHGFVEEDGGAVPGFAEIGEGGVVAGVVGDNAGAQSVVMPSQDLAVFIVGGAPYAPPSRR